MAEEEQPDGTPPAPDTPVRERSAERIEYRTPKSIRCGACRADVTVVEARISLAGSHEHFFRNPAGIRFRVACFAYAPGVEAIGFPTEEYTWFPGYAWSLALCRRCSSHLGWYYASTEGRSFYGLIVDRLIYPKE